jgi:hypothetical protein
MPSGHGIKGFRLWALVFGWWVLGVELLVRASRVRAATRSNASATPMRSARTKTVLEDERRDAELVEHPRELVPFLLEGETHVAAARTNDRGGTHAERIPNQQSSINNKNPQSRMAGGTPTPVVEPPDGAGLPKSLLGE